MRITLVTGKHALLIVSRIICFTSFCSLRFTTLTVVNFYFVGKSIHQIYVAKEQPLACLSIILIMLLSKNILLMKFQMHRKRDLLVYYYFGYY